MVSWVGDLLNSFEVWGWAAYGNVKKDKKNTKNSPFHTNLFTYSSVPWDVSSPKEIYLKQTLVKVSLYK
jgi:hypothetical protein